MQSRKRIHVYTAAEIAQYHNGGMSPAAMHALEKAALEDPFLSDALDGYAHAKNPTADIEVLKKRIRRRSGQVVPLFKEQRYLLGMAAMVVLLAGFGWLVYRLTTKNTTGIAVQTETKQKPKLQTEPNTPVENVAADTNANVPTGNQDTVVSKQALGEKAEAVAPQSSMRQGVQKRNPEAGSESFSNPHAASPATKAAVTATRRTPAKTYNVKVVDEQNQAVPFARVTDVARKQSLGITDTSGHLRVVRPDSSLTVQINSAGYPPSQMHLIAGDSATTIILPHRKAALHKETITAKSKRSAADRVRLEAVQPVDRRAFDAYVAGHLTWPDAEERGVRGSEVIILFDVDDEGNARNLTIQKTACAACDSSAVRLIREGAKWRKTKKEAQAKAFIRF